MAIISCPECGKQISDCAISCPYCGYPINTEQIAASQTNVNTEVEKLATLARRAREASDSKNAKKYYDQILIKDPGNWEAIFFSVYFEEYECKIREIASSSISVANCIHTTFIAIADLHNPEKEDEALITVIKSSDDISRMFAATTTLHYAEFSTVNGVHAECSSRIVKIGHIYSEIEKDLKNLFPDKKNILSDMQKSYVYYLSVYNRWYNKEYLLSLINRLDSEIKTVDPNYEVPKLNTNDGCYVATSVYGSYDCPEVWTLRRFRDDTLAKTTFGRIFIHTYYTISPTIVKLFGETRWFKNLFKNRLNKLVKSLNENGVKNTPYEDKNWRKLINNDI